VTNEKETQGAWRTPPEARAGLMRNLAIAGSRGLFPYWMNVGGGYFDDPELLRIVAEQIPVRQRVLTQPHAETEHAICLLLDDWSPLEEDYTSGFQQLAVVRQRNDELALTGLPWRIHLFDDLARDDFPVYRCYLLPNLFKLTPERLALIKAKLFRRGSVIICGPGTAISDGEQLSAKGASELLGFPMELIREQSARRVLTYGGSHPALAGVPGGLVYGDSYLYGPVLQPVRDLGPSGAVELGKFSGWWFSNRAGLVLKEFGQGAAGNGQAGERGEGDYGVVFSMATPVPALVLRSLALYGGCVPWSTAGDVVAASGTMLAVHSVRPGERELHLPTPATVTDAQTGTVIGRGITHFTITLAAPDTRVFLLSQ
jgi:hypothetical protein